jgi:hypothetical protein
LDLSFNALTGTIPVDWVDDMDRLRHLHLDHNQLVGTFPSIALGNGRIEQITVNDNQLTGVFPGDYTQPLFMQNLATENNPLSGMDSGVCDLIVYENGNLVELSTNCDICPCDMFCATPYCV